MTVLVYVFIAYVGFNMITKIFDTKQVDLSITETYKRDFPTIKLYDNNFYPIFSLY